MPDRVARARPPLFVAGDGPLYRFARALLSSGLRLYGRYDLRGAERLPASGPAIVVANHATDVDPIVLGLAFARPLRFMADAVLFRRAFVGRVVPRLGAFPVNTGDLDRRALGTALELLAAGEVVALFPEGALYGDGSLHPFHRGVGYLAAASGAPVVPAAITGALRVPDRRWLRRPTVRLDVGEPVVFDGAVGQGPAGWIERTARVESAVRELLERGLRAGRSESAVGALRPGTADAPARAVRGRGRPRQAAGERDRTPAGPVVVHRRRPLSTKGGGPGRDGRA